MINQKNEIGAIIFFGVCLEYCVYNLTCVIFSLLLVNVLPNSIGLNVEVNLNYAKLKLNYHKLSCK